MKDLAMRRLAVAFAATLAACGGGNGPTTNLAGSPVAAPPPPSPAPPAPAPAPTPPPPAPPPPAMPPPASGPPTIVEFSAAASGVTPALVGGSITLARDGNLWFNGGFTSSQIGRITPTGTVSYPVTAAAALGNFSTGPLTTGPDGNVWFCDPVAGITLAGTIGSIDVGTGVATEYPTPLMETTAQTRQSTAQTQSCTSSVCTPVPPGTCVPVPATMTTPATSCPTVTTGPTLVAACTPASANVVNAYTTTTCATSTVGPSAASTCTTTLPVAANSFTSTTCTGITPSSQAFAITTGPDGNLWFTEFVANRVGMFNPTTKLATEFGPLTSPATAIAPGPNGAVWFVEAGPPAGPPVIGRVTPLGAIGEFSSGLAVGETLGGLTEGADGAVWFLKSGFGGAAIGRLDPSTGIITFYTSGFSGAQPLFGGITAGPDGNVWFTDYFDGLIGRIAPDGTIAEFGAITPGLQINAITTGPLVGGAKTVWFTTPSETSIGRATLP
jgi:streptogramin lyase